MVKTRTVQLIGAISVAAGLVTFARVVADTTPGVARVAIPAATLGAGDSPYKYVGSKKCKKCHIKQHKSWSATKMGQALETLKPGNAADIKAKFNLDANKDYSTDAKCLKCHTVGFGKPGGYEVPNPDDKKSVRKAKKLAGVGCESCHGPGSGYVKIFKEIQKSKRKYKVEELHAAGLQKIDVNTCKTCHNEESPTTKAGDPFDFEERKAKGTHEHFPLKQREE